MISGHHAEQKPNRITDIEVLFFCCNLLVPTAAAPPGLIIFFIVCFKAVSFIGYEFINMNSA